MPEYIRALIFILVMAALVFKFSEASATANAMSKSSFVLRRNTWFYITLAGFLSQSVWIFYLVAMYVVYIAAKKESNKIALFFFLILAMPEVTAYIPGFAGINYFFAISYQRLLVGVILLPMFWSIFFNTKAEKIHWNLADIILISYFLLNIILQFQYIVVTEWLRLVLGWIFDVIIPYFVISRTVKNIQYLQEIIMAFLIGAMIVASISIFEYSKQWLLYQTLIDAIGIDGGAGYISRGDRIRAIATTGQAIVLGYVLAVAISLYLSVYKCVPDRKSYIIGMCLLVFGVIAPLSKGPWVGVVVSITTISVLGPKAVSVLLKLAFFAFLTFSLLMMTEYGSIVISYLPFVGSLDESSMDYRTLLLEKSMSVIYANPYFGSNDYLLYLEDMRQGQGIIDIVNSYVGVALESGLIGLTLFILFFVSVLTQTFLGLRKTVAISDENKIGRVLIGTIVGILLMISAVSSITNIPMLYWSISAMGIAYSLMRFPSEGGLMKKNN